MSTRINKLCVSLVAAAFIASPVFAGDVKTVSRDYQSNEHNANYRELDTRTSKNAKSAASLKKSLKKQVSALTRKNKGLSQRIAALDVDFSALSQSLQEIADSITSVRVQVRELTGRVLELESEMDDVQSQLADGNAKSIIAHDIRDDGSRDVRGFNNLSPRGALPRLSFNPDGSFDYIIDFGVPMEDRFWTITTQFAKTRPDVTNFSRAEGNTIRISFASLEFSGLFFFECDFQLMVY